MAKSIAQHQARTLRREGESIKVIARSLGVSKSSVSIWCSDIRLTREQMHRLEQRMVLKGSYEARIKGGRIQHERRQAQIVELKKIGQGLVKDVDTKALFYLGAGLYWGEGVKKKRVAFCNSDPSTIHIIIKWFRLLWGVRRERLTCSVLINKLHEKRVSEVEHYWSKKLRIPLNQFRKTILIKTVNKKTYENFANHYGTLMVIIRESGDLIHQINGLLEKIGKKI